jgi:hypothetical protein
MMINAPRLHKLVTALYPEGDPYLSSDVAGGVKKSLVVVSGHVHTYVFFCLASLTCDLAETHRNR